VNFKRAGFLEGGMTAMRTAQMPETGCCLQSA